MAKKIFLLVCSTLVNGDDTFGNSSIMAAKISTEDKMYWGCMNRDLWPWLNEMKGQK